MFTLIAHTTHVAHKIIGSPSANNYKAMVALATSFAKPQPCGWSYRPSEVWVYVNSGKKNLFFDFLLYIALRNVWFSHSTSESAAALKCIFHKEAKCVAEIY